MECRKSLSVKTVPFAFSSFQSCIAVFIVLSVAVQTVSALANSERTALQQILNNFQDLTSVAAWETTDQYGNYYGRSWNTSFDDLCLVDGYDYYGIFCRNGQVVGLRVTSHWGFSVSGDFGDSVGLVNLVNFTDTTADGLGTDIIKVLALNIPLRNVERRSLELVNFSMPETLESLSGVLTQGTHYSFTNMTNLQSLRLSVDGPAVDLSELCNSSLKGIFLSNFNDSQLVDLVNCLPTLQQVTFLTNRSIASDSDTLHLVSSSVTYLSLSSAVPTLVVDCPMLESLIISSSHPEINVTAPNLKLFTTRSPRPLPSSFSSFTLLESFSWAFANDSVPLMSFAPNLKSFSLESSTIRNSNLTELWQSIPSTIQTISLYQVSFTGSTEIIFPSHWTSLTRLILRTNFPTGSEFNVPSILQLHTLEALEYIGQSSFGDLKNLYGLTNLKKLRFGVYNSSVIPQDFFRRMPQLIDVSFTSGFFKGPIPWYGWENVESASFSGYFTSWPALVGTASKLKYLYLSTPRIQLIPTDEDFRAANMTSLVSLEFNDMGPTGTIPVPSFWAELPKLRHVEFYGFRFGGPLNYSIQAPMLSTLRFTFTSLCGPLPDFSIPTHLESIDLRLSKFSGTIPTSWEENLSIRSLSLWSNPVSGTVPPKLLTHHINTQGFINLQGTSLSGPIWNMSRGIPSTLDIAGTSLDICDQDPDYVGAPNSTDCNFNNIPKCPNRCPSYWEACKPLSTPCTESIAAAPTPTTCAIRNVSCTLPSPGNGFRCNRGVWILLEDWSDPLTLPPNAGTVIVYGNIVSNGTIVFSGIGTTIHVEGCVESVEEVILELSSVESSGSITLLTQLGSNCTKDLGSIPIQLIAPQIECKSLKVFNAHSKTSLNIAFSLEDTCSNTSKSSTKKWIILGSSIGGVLVVFVASFGILYTRSPGIRAFVRSCDIRKALTAK